MPCHENSNATIQRLQELLMISKTIVADQTLQANLGKWSSSALPLKPPWPDYRTAYYALHHTTAPVALRPRRRCCLHGH